ncbi:calcium channel, voltage-dependent, gamma subunit 7a [Osmerus eperlanus]|uniref:calcium channel, voltage-dependent, gamma subunit 7a n=1 Tax=Osmerus eperlanus TaxID=29151 RepID=UPI002E165AA3
MSSFSTRALTLLSSVFGACGLLLVGVAVSTDYWLLMEEGIVLQQNQTTEVKMALHSGLWRVCFVAGAEKGRCVASEYFSADTEIEITTENTANILKMVRTATPFPMVSLLFVFTAFVISNIGHIRPQRTILAFVSGIFFILSGQGLWCGLVIIYMLLSFTVCHSIQLVLLYYIFTRSISFHLSLFSLSLSQGAGVMSVYLFMKRYAEEEMYRPHPALYRPRLSECSDYSGQFLHPDSWPPPQRGRSASEVSSDISIQLNQTPPPPPPKGSSSQQTPSSGPSSGASYQLQPASSSSSSSYPHSSHPLHPSHPHSSHPSGLPSQSVSVGMPPSAVPPPRYHTHMRMSASPC